MSTDVGSGLAEVWVVDNASDDGSAELVRTSFPWAKLIASPENVGFGGAVNMVARETRSPWLAAANADIELTGGALETLLGAGEGDQSIGIVAPRLVLPDGRTQHSVYSFPTLPFTLAFNLGVTSLSARLADQLALEGKWNPERARAVDWAIGAFLLIRRAAWDAAGGFDAQQWMYAEDLDLGWRVATNDWRTQFEPAAVVRHHSAAATSQLWGNERDAQWMRSTYAWMEKRRGVPITRAVAFINTAGAAIRFALLTPLAFALGGTWAQRRTAMRRWTKLHLENLRASRVHLAGHR
jgi:GT2 family glycosyltransferase